MFLFHRYCYIYLYNNCIFYKHFFRKSKKKRFVESLWIKESIHPYFGFRRELSNKLQTNNYIRVSEIAKKIKYCLLPEEMFT